MLSSQVNLYFRRRKSNCLHKVKARVPTIIKMNNKLNPSGASVLKDQLMLNPNGSYPASFLARYKNGFSKL